MLRGGQQHKASRTRRRNEMGLRVAILLLTSEFLNFSLTSVHPNTERNYPAGQEHETRVQRRTAHMGPAQGRQLLLTQSGWEVRGLPAGL